MGRNDNTVTDQPGTNEKILFWASFLTLIAAGIGFSVRGAILGDWASRYGFTQTELGNITGGGLTGFGITIIVLSFVADRIGYGRLMTLAFFLHASSAVVTFLATPMYGLYGKTGAFWCLNIGMWLFALGNGTCEAVINPLTATLFPRNKTHWLNILHAGWPAGLVLGALIVLGFKPFGKVPWEYKLGAFLVPVLLYGLMMFGRVFPKSEASTTGISLGTMVLTLAAPMLLFLFLIHAMVGYVELGTDSWITDITKTVLKNESFALGAFIWTNVLMFTLRFFAGPIVHRINPVGLLLGSAVLGTAGLYMLGMPFTSTIWLWLAAVTVYGIGKTFYWPTMLGVISERFPKGGALALGISGGIGMISAGALGAPGIGFAQDFYAVQSLKANNAVPTYERYQATREDKETKQQVPDEKTYLGFTGLFPKVVGIDGSKKSILLGDPGENNGDAKKLADDIENIRAAAVRAGKPATDPPLLDEYKELRAQLAWWETVGKPHADEDRGPLGQSQLDGGKNALMLTAAIPATMAVCYLLLLLYFMVTGGYKQIHLHEDPEGKAGPVEY
jgi:MFS family permease